ncbi:hypothetical protein GC173_11310 [bacterium]|nr:hypothetical protein [bacterium]
MRVVEPGYESLDPLALPWKQLRRTPQDFPDWHVAKVSSARTVVGMTVAVGGRDERIYFKRSLRRSFVDRLQALVRPSKEWREWNLARAIGAAGVWVPKPLFYGEAFDPSVGCAAVFLATRALEPSWREAKAFFKEHKRYDREWKSLAAFTRRLHDLDIYHADYRSDHVYFDQTRVGVWEDLSAWALIDLDGSRVGEPVKRPARLRALLQLTESLLKSGLTLEQLKEFIAIYDPTGQWGFDAAPIHAEALRNGARH